MYQLFSRFAHRYDLHTPPDHYRHDHAFVLAEALRVAPKHCRLLDIGCGTGVFLTSACAAGIDGHGIDASTEMIDRATRRLSNQRLRVQRMQEVVDRDAYDVVCALSWTIHYCESGVELHDVLGRFHSALRPGGLLVLQVADDRQMIGAVNIDREAGPSGEPDDTILIHRFRPQHDEEHTVIADYVYASCACRELLSEQHRLTSASPSMIIAALQGAGFRDVRIVNEGSLSPFVTGVNAAG